MPTVFDRDAHRYDRARRQLVPCLDELYGWVVRLLPFAADSEIRVLDLGAGTGLMSATLSAAFPNARITLLDASAPMLKGSERRFGRDGRFQYRVSDYAREPLEGAYHAIVSGLSIHHLNAYEKRGLFRRVRVALEAGGVFVNADQVRGPTPEIEKHYQADWIRSAQKFGVSDQDLLAALDRQQADQASTLLEQLSWLEEAGFRNVNCWYKNQRFAVMAGER